MKFLLFLLGLSGFSPIHGISTSNFQVGQKSLKQENVHAPKNLMPENSHQFTSFNSHEPTQEARIVTIINSQDENASGQGSRIIITRSSAPGQQPPSGGTVVYNNNYGRDLVGRDKITITTGDQGIRTYVSRNPWYPRRDNTVIYNNNRGRDIVVGDQITITSSNQEMNAYVSERPWLRPYVQHIGEDRTKLVIRTDGTQEHQFSFP